MLSVTRSRPTIEVSLQSELSRLIAEKQQEISTGRRLEKPSDDPASWAQISDIAKQQSNISAWLNNVDRAQSIVRQAEAAINDINNQLIRANELLIQASSETSTLSDRENIAIEIDAINANIASLIDRHTGSGAALFSETEPLQIPVGDGETIAAAPGKDQIRNLVTLTQNIADSVRTGSPNERATLLNDISVTLNDMTNLLGAQGVVGSRLDNIGDHLRQSQLDLSIYRSSLEDADISQSITSMQRLLVNLQAAQASFVKIQQTSLFNLIR